MRTCETNGDENFMRTCEINGDEQFLWDQWKWELVRSMEMNTSWELETNDDEQFMRTCEINGDEQFMRTCEINDDEHFMSRVYRFVNLVRVGLKDWKGKIKKIAKIKEILGLIML